MGQILMRLKPALASTLLLLPIVCGGACESDDDDKRDRSTDTASEDAKRDAKENDGKENDSKEDDGKEDSSADDKTADDDMKPTEITDEPAGLRPPSALERPPSDSLPESLKPPKP